ncbi:MAG: carbamoyl phosphate synthase small subunit, partial [Clostridia bacterium]|nr:carbamoyl phosphate synthase small subunit [Clostridia bacterium]
MKKAYLILENGTVFEGYKIGADKETVGEVVFTTGMCGYLETLTDPSYAGQIVVQTFPLIGNYGVIPQDFEGECAVKGYVVRTMCDAPSNFRSEYKLDEFLKERGVCGICGIDTRRLTRIIREQGVMNGTICDGMI